MRKFADLDASEGSKQETSDQKTTREEPVLNKDTKRSSASEGMEIFVKMLTGKITKIGVEQSDLIQDVKEKLYHQEGIPTDQQRLMFSGRELMDGNSLKDCNIQTNLRYSWSYVFGIVLKFPLEPWLERPFHYLLNQPILSRL